MPRFFTTLRMTLQKPLKAAETGVESGNRRYGGEGACLDALDRTDAPHVAAIRVRIRRLIISLLGC